MANLAICFDGTWKRAQDTHVSNIEKIARTLVSRSSDHHRTVRHQTVYYVGGVGASYAVDRVLGGSLGLGLSNNLMNGYRFLALNYTPGDHVFVFGFSRGAFTARSLVGMINRVGLVRADALIHGALKTAGERYRRTTAGATDPTGDAFRSRHCHQHVCIPFVGVFDTVEALGPNARFHNIDFLRDAVAVGRQALAVDERRRIFRPRLWGGACDLTDSGRVRQAWFEGFHSDVGGGVKDTGLPDTTLLWMAAEATRQGLVFDHELLADYLTLPADRSVGRSPEAVAHDSMTPGYRATNLVLRAPWARSRRAYADGRRVLEPEGSVGVRIGGSAVARYAAGSEEPPNVSAWVGGHGPAGPPVEDVLSLPLVEDRSDGAPRRSLVLDVLARARAAATDAGGAVHPCPSPAH